VRQPRRPRITQRIIAGIINATSAILAGSPEEMPGATRAERLAAWHEVQAADEWARDMRDWMQARPDAEARRKRWKQPN